MFKNRKYMPNLGKVHILAWISIILIIFAKVLYMNWMHYLSAILVMGSGFVYLFCFVWLFERRQDQAAKGILKITLGSFMVVTMLYIGGVIFA